MRGTVHQPVRTPLVVAWPIEAGRVLEEQHLCAWAESAKARERFVTDLAANLAQFDDTAVCVLDGSGIHNLPTLCAELERALGVGSIGRSLDLVGGEGGVVGALRRRPHIAGAPPIKRRFIIWSEAHVLLKSDAKLFGRAADAIMGVAAEHEFCSDDVLLIQRAVFVGKASLDMYAEDPKGQFRSWYSEYGEAPLWRVVTGLEHPSVSRWRIGRELDAP